MSRRSWKRMSSTMVERLDRSVLAAMAEAGEALTVNQLTIKTGRTPRIIRRALDRLDEQGAVRRKPVPDSRGIMYAYELVEQPAASAPIAHLPRIYTDHTSELARLRAEYWPVTG